jgi:hypothetical protein
MDDNTHKPPDDPLKSIKFYVIAATIMLVGATAISTYKARQYRTSKREQQVKSYKAQSVEQIDANKDGRLDILLTNGLGEKQTFFDVDGKYMTIDQITEKYGTEGAKEYKKKEKN